MFPFSGKGKIRSIPDDDNDDDVVVFCSFSFILTSQSFYRYVCFCCCCYHCFVVFVCNAIVDVVVVIKGTIDCFLFQRRGRGRVL